MLQGESPPVQSQRGQIDTLSGNLRTIRQTGVAATLFLKGPVMTRFICLSAVLISFACGATSASAWQQAKETCINALLSDGSKTYELMVVEDFAFIGSPDLSPDGKKVALDGWKTGQTTQDAHLLIADLETGDIRDLGPGAMPTWSPEGSLIAFSQYSGGVWIRSVNGTESKQIDANGWGIQWSPDGRKLAYTIGGQLMIYDILADKKKEVFPAGGLPYQHLYWNCTWSPDSKKVAVKAMKAENTFELAIVTVEGDKPEVHFCGSANDLLEDIAWHPDGTRLVVPNHKGRLMVFKPEGNEPSEELKGQPSDRSNSGSTWSRDGKVLVFMSTK
jgi:TolB protein